MQHPSRSSARRTALLAAALFALGAGAADPAPPPPAMKAEPPDPAAACTPDSLSACGLPSQVVIDMTRVRVQRTDAEWRRRLRPESYRVARQQGTEPAFRNAYWNFKGDGVFACAGCDSPLFDTRHKFDSGTGWPSFWQPLEKAFVAQQTDTAHGRVRTEVHCAVCGSHLGHVFDDGPRPTGLRYCINSASLQFLDRAAYPAWLAANATPAPKPPPPQ